MMKSYPLPVLSEARWVDRSRGWAWCAAIVADGRRTCRRWGQGRELGVELCKPHGRAALKRGVSLVEPSAIGLVTAGEVWER
jgi:hypothetical protein